jgi:hypothetical protein
MNDPQTIFCCEHVKIRNENKPYKDPYREHYGDLYQSFIAFSERRQRAWALMRLIRDNDPRPVAYYPRDAPSSSASLLRSVLTREASENNPITLDTPYIIHLTTRHDFGPVISHRYFACPANFEHDWKEATLVQWFAKGEQFKLKAHKWDFKCPVDSLFYRMILRPNLVLRSMPGDISKD